MFRKDAAVTKTRPATLKLARILENTQRGREVVLVITHQDCDAIEPAHEALALQIEEALRPIGVAVIAATPAWETEAWWFLWPDAVVAAFPSWRKPKAPQDRVGLIRDAKEVFRLAVRPEANSAGNRDYKESDSPKIAAKVRELGIIDQKAARSDSFDDFAKKVRALQLQ